MANSVDPEPLTTAHPQVDPNYPLGFMAARLHNQKHGNVLVLFPLRNDGRGVIWYCLCDCGSYCELTSHKILNRMFKMCDSCARKAESKKKKIDRIGKKYHKLLVIKEAGYDKSGKLLYSCSCDCGGATVVRGEDLYKQKSCGCYKMLTSAQNGRKSAEKTRGKNSLRYKPELTDEDRTRGGEGSKIWRGRVYTRDNYTCVVCNVRGGDLVPHHMNSWAKYHNQRYEVSNGKTLCNECHEEFHNVFMGGKNYGCSENDFVDYCFVKGLYKSYLKPSDILSYWRMS